MALNCEVSSLLLGKRCLSLRSYPLQSGPWRVHLLGKDMIVPVSTVVAGKGLTVDLFPFGHF